MEQQPTPTSDDVVVPARGDAPPAKESWPAEERLYSVFPEEARFAGCGRRGKKATLR